jgi:hypothetical protein
MVPYTEIAAQLGLTQEGARQLCLSAQRKFVAKLHEVLEREGLTLEDLFDLDGQEPDPMLRLIPDRAYHD